MADISQLSDGVTTWDIKDATARSSIANAITTAGTGLSKSGNTLNHSNSVTAGTIGQSSATSGSTLAVPYATYDAQGHVTGKGTHTHTVNSLPASAISSGTISTSRLPSDIVYQPAWTVRNYDVLSLPLVNALRANRLALLPADQIIIEQTTDGGVTWTDAGITDAAKRQLFLGTSATTNVSIPLLNGYQDKNCGVRITITAMKYDVPDNTAETAKYNYWNANYVLSQERYCSLTNLYCWVNTNGNNAIALKIEYATGANSTTWNTVKNFSDGQTLIGYSGGDVIYGLGNKTFGGGTTQTGNNWNWRFTFMTEANVYGEALVSRTAAQSIMRIQGFGASAWGVPNNLVGIDHLYSWDYDKNAVFPAAIRPATTGTQDLGATTYKWRNIYANQVYANTSYYGTCSTAAGTAAKVVVCSGFQLATGARISVFCTTANTVTGSITLNVNNTGAKTVLTRNTSSYAHKWEPQETLNFIYDGTYWRFESSNSQMLSTQAIATSANTSLPYAAGFMRVFAVNTSTTGGPSVNGMVCETTHPIDTTFGAQLFLPIYQVSGRYPQWRATSGANSWGTWNTFYTTANPPAFSEITGALTASQSSEMRLFAPSSVMPEIATLGAGTVYNTGQYQDFDHDFWERVDFIAPTNHRRYCLAGLYNRLPAIGLELNANNCVRAYCQSNSGALTDKVFDQVLTDGSDCTVILHYIASSSTLECYIRSGADTSFTSVALSIGTGYTGQSPVTVLLGGDYRDSQYGGGTFASLTITKAPAIYYEAEQATGEYEVTWDVLQSGGEIIGATEPYTAVVNTVIPIATAADVGAVKPDGQSVIVSSDGTLTATPAAVGMTCTERKGGVSLDDYNLEAGGGSSWPSDGGWGWREEVWNDGRLTVYYWKWFATTGSGWQRLWTNMPYPTDATPFVDTPFPTATIMDNGAQVEGASMVNLTSLRSASNTTGFKILYYNLSSNSSSKKLVLVRLDGHWWKEGGSDPDDPTPAEQWAVGDAISIGGNSYYPVTEWKVSDSGAGGDSRLKAAVRFLITTSSTSGAWHVYAQYAAWTDSGYVPTSSQNGYMLIRKLNSQITTYTNDAGVKAKGDVWSTLNTNQRQGYVYNAVVEGHLIWGDTPYIITDCGTFTNGQTVSSKTFYVGTTEVSGGVYTQTSVSDTTTTPTSS